jgi:hypothetical protein
MRRFVKPAVWAGVFLACAGAGAFIAANTDPFPPGVDRPTGPTAATTGPTPSPEPADQRWTGRLSTVARHDFYVGGTCRSRWDTDLRLVIDPAGAVTGSGVGRPVGEASCDFPNAQEEARRVRMAVGGRLTLSGVLRIWFDHVTPAPDGSTDLGGFFVFLTGERLVLEAEEGTTAGTSFRTQRDDGNRGTYRFAGSAELVCSSGCQQA